MICWLYNPDVSWCASSFLSWNYGKGSPAAPFWAEHGRTMTQGRSLVSGRTAPRMLCAECITRTMKRKPWIAWLRWRRFMKISHAIRITYTHIWCICIIINTIYKLYIYTYHICELCMYHILWYNMQNTYPSPYSSSHPNPTATCNLQCPIWLSAASTCELHINYMTLLCKSYLLTYGSMFSRHRVHQHQLDVFLLIIEMQQCFLRCQ
jgi:hypothetical protein